MLWLRRELSLCLSHKEAFAHFLPCLNFGCEIKIQMRAHVRVSACKIKTKQEVNPYFLYYCS